MIKDRLTAQKHILGHLEHKHHDKNGGLEWMKMIANEYMKMDFVYEFSDHEISNKIEASDIIKFFVLMVDDGDIPKQEWITA
jgi:hypothetical protein